MPWFVLAAAFAAFYARMMRGNLIEVMGEDYIRTARAKGLSERRVVVRHGLRATLTPVVTIAGLDVGILLGGAILTETVFNIPGVGRYAYDSIINSDLPAIQELAGPARGLLHHRREHRRRRPLRVPRPARPVFLMALLEVRELRVSFDTFDGVVHAVDGASYGVEAGAVRSASSASPAPARASPRSRSWA